VCFQVQVSATCRSLVQRSPTARCVCVCVCVCHTECLRCLLCTQEYFCINFPLIVHYCVIYSTSQSSYYYLLLFLSVSFLFFLLFFLSLYRTLVLKTFPMSQTVLKLTSSSPNFPSSSLPLFYCCFCQCIILHPLLAVCSLAFTFPNIYT
jgi:hypothetical protein